MILKREGECPKIFTILYITSPPPKRKEFITHSNTNDQNISIFMPWLSEPNDHRAMQRGFKQHLHGERAALPERKWKLREPKPFIIGSNHDCS